MAKDGREPQSYGSQNEWVTGKTGQAVHDPKSVPPASQDDFYDERRESESNASYQGGKTSDVQLSEHAGNSGHVAESVNPIPRVTTAESGAKRGSWFKRRDYE